MSLLFCAMGIGRRWNLLKRWKCLWIWPLLWVIEHRSRGVALIGSVVRRLTQAIKAGSMFQFLTQPQHQSTLLMGCLLLLWFSTDSPSLLLVHIPDNIKNR